ncbi:MAG: O-acetyl-ADP-ribose deacetylase [Limisphaerales bacterium]
MNDEPTFHKRVEVVEGNIVRLQVEALVNAANESLLGGGGVDGAIHQAAGPELLAECRTLNGCATGEAKITKGYRLPAKWVIHTVGPIWRGGRNGEDGLLARCYRNSLALAAERNIESIAFPSISTGLYRFPMDRAAEIALKETIAFLQKNSFPRKVVFVCYGRDAWSLYLDRARHLIPGFEQ